MSLNLSSSDEEDFDEWVNGATHTTTEPEPTSPAATKSNAFASAIPESESEDDSDDFEGLEWEDAPQQDQDTSILDRKMPAREVQIDLGARKGSKLEERQSNKRKRKRRTKLSNRFLPDEMRQLLIQLSRAHLLCLTTSMVGSSKNCTDLDTLAIVASLVPPQFLSSALCPTVKDLQLLAEEWLFPFVNNASRARSHTLWRNRAEGAPRRRTRQKANQRASATEERLESSVVDYARYLAMQYDENPQLLDTSEMSLMEPSPRHKTLFALALARSFGWKARLVQVLEPMLPVLDVDHPLLQSCADVFRSKSSRKAQPEPAKADDSHSVDSNKEMTWIEILCTDASAKTGHRWIPLDPDRGLLDSPQAIAKQFKSPLAYAVGVEHKQDSEKFRICDVTPRYASSWIATLRQRGVRIHKKSAVNKGDKWWTDTIRILNHCHGVGKSAEDAVVIDDNLQTDTAYSEVAMEDNENEELNKLTEQETIPTSKAAFQTHPIYAIPSVLGKAEVLAPDANKRVCGVFKGQMVYKRTDVSTALPPQKWLYQGRKVKSTELRRPIKRVKARKKPAPKSFKALKSYGVGAENDGSEQQRERVLQKGSDPLSDGMESLYAVWQTEKWSPLPVGPSDKIPINEYRNIELALLNPGLVHVDQPGLAAVAKKLGIPYAPCLLGFEGHGGNRTPTLRGIVVHEHNETIIREASVEWQNHEAEVSEAKRRKTIMGRWRRLMVGLLTKDRLDREYGDKKSKQE